jgi:hypothetical protein
MWEEVEINELARKVRDHVRQHRELRQRPNTLMSIVVTA